MTVAAKRRHSSSTDDKVEAKRKVIRKSLNEITAEVASAMRDANLHSPINIVVPTRHSLVTIASVRDLPPDEWSRMSEIVRQIVGKRLGGSELRGRELARAVANAMMDAASVGLD
jgi:hypothetical protein